MKFKANAYAELIAARTPEDFTKLNCRVLMRDGVIFELGPHDRRFDVAMGTGKLADDKGDPTCP